MMKKKIQSLMNFVLGTKQGEALSLLSEIMEEKVTQGKYLGLCETLERLGISPAQWSDIKKGKCRIEIVKIRKNE